MNRRNAISLTTLALLCLGLALSAGDAVAQQKSLKQQLVGIWTLVSFEVVEANGNKMPGVMGKNPQGQLILTDSGRISFQVIAELPKLAANDRFKATPDENKAVMQGAFSYFGTYTVNEGEKSITWRIERSTNPSQNGLERKQMIASVTADELRYSNPARLAGGTTNLVWKRAK